MKRILRILPNPKKSSDAYEIDKYGNLCGVGDFEKIEIHYSPEEFNDDYLIKKLESNLRRLSLTNGKIIWKNLL
jgi:hypothetical protein